MNITIPQYVDLKTLAVLFDSSIHTTRNMLDFLSNQGYAVEVVAYGAGGRYKKYNYAHFKRALLEYTDTIRQTNNSII